MCLGLIFLTLSRGKAVLFGGAGLLSPFCTNPKDKGIAEEFEKLSRRRLEGGE